MQEWKNYIAIAAILLLCMMAAGCAETTHSVDAPVSEPLSETRVEEEADAASEENKQDVTPDDEKTESESAAGSEPEEETIEEPGQEEQDNAEETENEEGDGIPEENDNANIVGAWQVESDVFIFEQDGECRLVNCGTEGTYTWLGQYSLTGAMLLIRWETIIEDASGQEYAAEQDIVYPVVEISGDTIRIYDDGNGLFEPIWREGVRVE